MRIYKRNNDTGRIAQFLERLRIARINQARKGTRSATVIDIMISEVSAYRAIISCVTF